MVYGWQHWPRVQDMANPVGYLYVVGKRSVHTERPAPPLREAETVDDPWVEPGLETGLQRLSEQQRTAVILHHCFSWTYQEIADLLDVSVSTVRNHIERGMEKLRSSLKVAVDD